ncbi:MAG: transcription antitermination factor NusB [Atopobiaceae bacterium]|nr:transcription antitermination factor NusB [Atopobiaceae bacterium]
MPNLDIGVSRHTARIQALELLFQTDMGVNHVEDLLNSQTSRGDCVTPLISQGPLDSYAEQLALGATKYKYSFDRTIEAASDNWALERMPVLDRVIMRIALFEMLLVDEVETAVCIDEAVELAKEYGTEDSPRFVNGILGRIARDIENNTSPLLELKQQAQATRAYASDEPDVVADADKLTDADKLAHAGDVADVGEVADAAYGDEGAQ